MPSVRSPLAAAALIVGALPAAAEQAPDTLYSATVIVTGRDNPAERDRGIAEAVAAVLVRVGADPALAHRWRERTGDRTPEAGWIEDLRYVDRKEGIPISDEQGARDRSFAMTVAFEPEAIDAALSDLGGEPWPLPRPPILVDLTIGTDARAYRLTAAGEDGYAQRLALLDAAEDLGLAIDLPADPQAGSAGPARLTGAMRTTFAGLWDSDWHLADGTNERRHAVRAQSFDATFADALAFAAATLKAGR